MPPEPPPIHPDRLRQSLFRFVDLLESRHIPYMIIGAMAVAMWGQPRATADVDFTVLTDPEGLESLGAEAERQGFVIDRQWLEWNPLQREFQMRLMRRRSTAAGRWRSRAAPYGLCRRRI